VPGLKGALADARWMPSWRHLGFGGQVVAFSSAIPIAMVPGRTF